jgi:hypothetical protein
MACYLRTPNHKLHYCDDCQFTDSWLKELPCRKCFPDGKYLLPGERQKCGFKKKKPLKEES